MTSPESGATHGQPPLPPRTAVAGPCGPARAEVDVRCAEAERLLATAQSHQVTLRESRRQHSEASRMRESDNGLRDRRQLDHVKAAAQVDYHAAVNRAVDLTAVHESAAGWLGRINQINHDARVADERADALAQQVNDLERSLPGLEMAADAARIASEAAQALCMESRRALAACEEESQLRTTPGVVAEATPVAEAPTPTATYDSFGRRDTAPGAAAASALMRGGRQTLLGLALRLADETGIEAGRLQLLLLELREQIAGRALEEYALVFPTDHPFWSQFSADAARTVAVSLASMGFRFDGTGAWADGRAPQIRDLAMALSYCGYDPRSLRRPAGQAAIDGLWEGTVVGIEEYLLARAPDLALSQIVAVLGPTSGRLDELWDIWGRLRPLLIRIGTPAA